VGGCVCERHRILAGRARADHDVVPELAQLACDRRPDDTGSEDSNPHEPQSTIGGVTEIRQARADESQLRLWVLEDNSRARRFYERRGWRENGESRIVEFPPNPLDIGYSLDF
jgi:hypothetical protein